MKLVLVKAIDKIGAILIEEKKIKNSETYCLNNILTEDGRTIMAESDDFELLEEVEDD